MTTALTVACPQCGKQVHVPESAIGKTGRCGACQHRFVIQPPASADAAPDEEYGLSPADANPPGPAVARKAAWQQSAHVAGSKSQGQTSLEAVARQEHKPRYEATEYLTMGLYIGGAGLLLAALLLGVLIWCLTA
jgi:hypothetical protein